MESLLQEGVSNTTQDMDPVHYQLIFEGISGLVMPSTSIENNNTLEESISSKEEKKQSNIVHAAECDINGEPFILEYYDDQVLIRHHRWSLQGIGKNYLEALKDLIDEARDVSEFYLSQPLNSLSVFAVEFRVFLTSIAKLSYNG